MRFVLISVLLFYKSAFGQTDFSSAVEYNAFIVHAQREVVKKNLDYISFSVHSDDPQSIELKRKAVLTQIRKAKANIADMPPFQGNSRLKDEAIDVLTEYQHAFGGDFREVLHLKKASQNSFEAMEAWFKAQQEMEWRVNKATQKFNDIQQRFAEQHNLTFVDSEEVDNLTECMERVTALNQYLRNIYLEYFKVSKAFAGMLDLLHAQKGAPLEKQRRHVIDLVNEAIPVLQAIEPFDGDDNYPEQTIELLEYYRELSKNEFAKIVALFNKKSGIDRQDADYINKILRSYNRDAGQLMMNMNVASEELLQRNLVFTQ